MKDTILKECHLNLKGTSYVLKILSSNTSDTSVKNSYIIRRDHRIKLPFYSYNLKSLALCTKREVSLTDTNMFHNVFTILTEKSFL